MNKHPDRYLLVDPWRIIEKGFHRSRQRVSESLFSLANEYMGVRGYFDEIYSGDSLRGSYMTAVYESVPGTAPYRGISTSGNFMVNTLDWLSLRIKAGGRSLDLDSAQISGFYRELDLRTGVLSRSFTWVLAPGRKLKLSFRRFVSMDCAQLGCQEIAITSLGFRGSVEVEQGLDFSIDMESKGGVNYWQETAKGKQAGQVWIMARTRGSGQRLFSVFSVDTDFSVTPRVVKRDKYIGLKYGVQAAPGGSYTLQKKVVNLKDIGGRKADKEMIRRGQTLLKQKAAPGFDTLLRRHSSYWEKVWSELDIIIEGDPVTQQGIRFCIFQLHQTYHGQDKLANIGANGLTGEKYNGHTFWDTESYCLNFYLFNNPRAARSLLKYRHSQLKEAVKRAAEIDCRGACYPFATITGTEDCGLWWIANTEVHVGLAVFYALWHYIHVSDDKAFLYKEGIEMLLQLSRFYASRGQWSQVTGDFGLYGVMGPDEFKLMVNNNCYMNLLMKKTFKYTLQVLAEMQKAAPVLRRRVIKKLGVKPAELGDWKKMAARTRILQDKKSGIFEQNDGFFDMPHIERASIPNEHFPLYGAWSYDRLYRYDMHKQPDVLLFMFFFNAQFSKKEKKANYEYYEPRCIHESSLSPGIHSILASELDKHKEAFNLGSFASRLDLDDYNRNTCMGLHTTSLAAAWMTLVNGFGGMRSDGPCLSFDPAIPGKWKAFEYRIRYRGAVITVRTEKTRVILSADGEAVTVKVFGRKYRLSEKQTVVRLPAGRKA